LQQLEAWKDEYLGDYNPPRNEGESEEDWKNRKKQLLENWINQLELRLSQLASILHLDRIIAKIPPTCSRLVLIPHLYLHLFPLHLDILRRTGTAHFSCHGGFNFEFPLSSSLILAESFLPTGGEAPPPAEHSQAEPGNEVTPSPKKEEREKAEEGDKRYLTLRDGRKANPEKCLTLQDIFASLELPQCRLVTLSACETGLTGAPQKIDEYIGLPSGFLYAGSRARRQQSLARRRLCHDGFDDKILSVLAGRRLRRVWRAGGAQDSPDVAAQCHQGGVSQMDISFGLRYRI
jgi:hypothetical protein